MSEPRPRSESIADRTISPVSPANEEPQAPIRPADRRATVPRGRGWARKLITGVLLIAAIGLGYVIRDRTHPKAASLSRSAATPTATSEPTVWTCSMHPQIRQPKPGLCPICGMDLIPLELGGDEEQGLRELSISRAARELMDLRTAPVERRFVTATIRMVGKVTYDETRLGYITAWVPGRLDRLYVDYTGVEVKQGDHMVSIYSPDLYSAQAELIQAFKSTRERRSPAAAASAARLLESAREKLRLWGLTDAQIRVIEQQEQPSDHLTIYAPMSGIVIHKNAQEGMYVETGSRIYTIADLAQVWVKLDAYESDLTWLRYGQTVEFTTEAYPGEVFTGQVAFIDPVLDPKTRTVKVRVNVPNPYGKLKPDMFVRGEVHAQVATAGRVMEPSLVGKWICRMHPGVIKESPGDCDICGMPLVRTETLGYVSSAAASNESAEPLVVPASAVLMTGTRAVVYVERSDADQPTYEGREVVLGPRAGGFYLVQTGLEEGERVVTNGNFKLDSALQIAARPSMMNPEAGLAVPAAESRNHANVSPATRDRLRRILATSRGVSEAIERGDREAIRTAFLTVQEAIAAVDAGALEGEAANHWKELAMRLRNDAVEGRWAASPARQRRAFDELSADLARLNDRFGLAEASRPVLAGVPFATPAEFRRQLGRLWESYGAVQTALASDDAGAAKTAVDAVARSLDAVPMSDLEGRAHDAWMEVRKDLQSSIQKMQRVEDLIGLREAFAGLSAALPPVVASFGLDAASGPVYRLYCPMAFDGRGAAWLQADDQVRNPYFGPAMLKCATEVERIWNGPPAGTAPRPFTAPAAFRVQLGTLLDAYLVVGDALAGDDIAKARSAVASFRRALEGVEMGQLEGETHDAWMRELKGLRQTTERLEHADDLKKLREAFALLSESLPAIVASFGAEPAGALYQLHCPMAFGGRGASWLQRDDKARNPYFGAAMLTCADKVERIAVAPAPQGGREDHE